MKKSKKKKIVNNKFCITENCKCDLQPVLNDLFPYYSPNCLTESEFDLLKDNLIDKNDLNSDNKEIITKIYNRVFKQNKAYTDKVYNQIQRIYKEFL